MKTLETSKNRLPGLDICLSPEMIALHQPAGKIVVVVDILRATSCMVTAFAHKVESIIPVAELEECLHLKQQGYIACAERDGKMVEGFDLGNSPFGFMAEELRGKSIAMTTTNGTKAIQLSKEADTLIIGAFLNISAVAQYLIERNKDVLIVCAGWKGMVNAEDTLFAGALAYHLQENFADVNDTVLVAKALYHDTIDDMYAFLQRSSHVARLRNLGIEEDIRFCLSADKYEVIPVFSEGRLVELQTELCAEE